MEKRFIGPLTLRQRNLVQGLLRTDRDETDEEMVLALAGSKAPDGHARGMAKRRAYRLVEREVVESVSDDTLLRGLQKKQRPKTRLGCPRLTSAIDCPGVPYAVIGIACPP